MYHHLRDSVAVIAVILISIILCTCAPLLTYSAGLAFFGLIHVVREFYYIDHRFGARISPTFAVNLVMLLLLVMGIRIASVGGFAPTHVLYQLELVLVVMLAVLPQFYITSAHTSSRFISLVLISLLGCGFFASPSATIVVLAVLHNLTPMGFITEVVKPNQRKWALIICCVVFLLLPLLMASGLFLPLTTLFGAHENLTIFPTGPLDRHLGVFLPPWMRTKPWAHLAFSAVVFGQCMHYFAVILVMPKLLVANRATPLLPWPKPAFLWLAMGALSLALVFVYAKDFAYARSIYGIVAALHAYVEIPILFWAFASAPRLIKQSSPMVGHRTHT